MTIEPQVTSRIVLIGFMGTGKSTVSKMLADRLGWKQIDIDEEIVRSEGRAIPVIFTEGGEEHFRSIETKVLKSVLSDSLADAVIATGGGAVLRSENCEAMIGSSFVVTLKADAEQIIARVGSDSNRPLLEDDPAARVYALLEARRHAYDFAHFTVDTTEMTTNEVVESILQEWSKYQ